MGIKLTEIVQLNQYFCLSDILQLARNDMLT